MLAPESERLLRDRSYRIDVVKINAIHFIDARIDVARHCDIDDEKRAIHTLPRHRTIHSLNGTTAQPPTACANSFARSAERLLTRMSLTPRDTSARAVRSLVSPAPSTSTLQSVNFPKILCARSTATDPTDTAPRAIS